MGNSASSEEHPGASPQQAQVQQIRHSDSEEIQPQSTPVRRSPNKINANHINDNNIKAKSVKIEPIQFPHNYETIIQESDTPIDRSSPEELLQQLQAGVHLNGRKKKFWVGKGNTNCFMVYASGLKITWAEDTKYWNFQNVETREGQIPVAVLKSVCWLEVHGKLDIAALSPGIKYQVAYWIMLEFSSYGWEVPVNFRLTLPNGCKQEHKENLNDKPRGEWIRIPIGEFTCSSEIIGEIEFSLYEYVGGSWKKGLVIKCVTIEPKST